MDLVASQFLAIVLVEQGPWTRDRDLMAVNMPGIPPDIRRLVTLG
jgi:hypothetical protein